MKRRIDLLYRSLVMSERYIRDLSLKLQRWTDAYASGTPLVSDSLYDAVHKELDKAVGGSAEKFVPQTLTVATTGKHRVPMTTLKDVYTIEDIGRFVNGFPEGTRFIAEPKMDGMAISLTYENGDLVKGLTRGDYVNGELCTESISYVPSVPITLGLDIDMEVRGELVVTHESFTPDMGVSPRNFAAGSLMKGDQERNKHLTFIPYAVTVARGEYGELTSLHDKLMWLGTIGFQTNPAKILLGTRVQIIDWMKDMHESCDPQARPEAYMCAIDGLVLKVDDSELFADAGGTSKHPHGAIAFKYNSASAVTTIVAVEESMGRFGEITPVAIVEPVTIDGNVVTRATLHNYAKVLSKGVFIGGECVLMRAGGVIPDLVAMTENVDKLPIVSPPSVCPSCGAATIVTADLINTTCSREDWSECKARAVRTGAYIVSKKVLNIQGLGGKTIEKLYDLGVKLTTLHHVLTLSKDDLVKAAGNAMGKKVYDRIQSAAEMSCQTFIKAMCIKEIGNHASVILSEHVGHHPQGFLDLSGESIGLINGLAEDEVGHLVEFFGDTARQAAAWRGHDLVTDPMSPEDDPANKNADELVARFSNAGFDTSHKVCVTGSFEGCNRDDIHKALSNAGFTPTKSASANTALIAGDKPSASKVDKSGAMFCAF